MGPLTIRPYESGDEIEIVPLLQEVFRKWPPFDLDCSPLEHWVWKYRHNPLGPAPVTVACADGGMVACLHSVPRRMMISGRPVFCCFGPDMVVRPEHRRKGVSQGLNARIDPLRIQSGMDFAYFDTGSPILHRAFSGKLPLLPFQAARFIRIRDPGKHRRMKRHSRPLLKSLVYRGLNSFNTALNVSGRSRLQTGHVSVEDIASFDERIEQFWRAAAPGSAWIGERSRDFLNWRYCDLRGGRFMVKWAVERGTVLGYCVLRVNRLNPEYPQGYLADLLALPGRTDAAAALVRSAMSHLDDHGLNVVHSLMVKGHPYEGILRRHGFVDTRVRKAVFVKPYRDMESILRGIRQAPRAAIHFSYGDVDTV